MPPDAGSRGSRDFVFLPYHFSRAATKHFTNAVSEKDKFDACFRKSFLHAVAGVREWARD